MWNFRFQEQKGHGTFVPGKCHGTFIPGIELVMELSLSVAAKNNLKTGS